MILRIVAAACLLSLGGCQQSGRELAATGGVTAPSSLSMKAVDVPFAGTVTGETAFDFANPKGCASGFTAIGTGTGTASHIGRTTWESQHCLGPNNTFGDSELVLTAANGDEIHLTYTGSCLGEIPAVGDSFTCSGHALVTGGTGRFDQATGHLQWGSTVVFEGFDDMSWPGTWTWNGTIRY